MSNYIRVDHSKFETTALAVEAYVKAHRDNMKMAKDEVTALSSSWQGDDYKQFLTTWDKLDCGESTSERMLSSLTNYAAYLRFAANSYKKAQTNAVNRANSISKW